MSGQMHHRARAAGAEALSHKTRFWQYCRQPIGMAKGRDVEAGQGETVKRLPPSTDKAEETLVTSRGCKLSGGIVDSRQFRQPFAFPLDAVMGKHAIAAWGTLSSQSCRDRPSRPASSPRP
jgi:hypothetical protein